MYFRKLASTAQATYVTSDAESSVSVLMDISQIMTWFKLNKVKTHEILKDLHETSNLVISLIHLLPYGSSLNNNQKETIFHD